MPNIFHHPPAHSTMPPSASFSAVASSPGRISHPVPHPQLNLATCSPHDLHAYLIQLGISSVDADILLHEDVDGFSAPSLTHAHLQQMGIHTFGRRQRILSALSMPSSPSAAPAAFQAVAWKAMEVSSTAPAGGLKGATGLLSHLPLSRPHSAAPAPSPAYPPALLRPRSAHVPSPLPSHYPPSYPSNSYQSPYYSPIPSLPITPYDPTQPHLRPTDTSRTAHADEEKDGDFVAAYPAQHKPSYTRESRKAETEEEVRKQLRDKRVEDELRWEAEQAERQKEAAQVARLKEELVRRERTRQRVEDAHVESKYEQWRHHEADRRKSHRRAHSGEDEDSLHVSPARARPFPVHQPAKATQNHSAVISPPALTPPRHSLHLEWVYGYSASSAASRSTIALTQNGSIVYPASRVVVILTPASSSTSAQQSHFLAHTSAITTFALHPGSRSMVASSSSRPPQLFVWDHTSPHRAPLSLPLTQADVGVKALGFSACGRWLATVSSDSHATVRIWDWEAARCVASVHSGDATVHACQWSPVEHQQLVTVGKRHIAFWQWKDGRIRGQKAALPSSAEQPCTYESLAFSQKGYAIIGTSSGSVLVYTSVHQAPRVFDVLGSEAPIVSLQAAEYGLLCGCSDGRVVLTNKAMDRLKSLTFNARIRAVASRGKGEAAVATRDGRLYLIPDVWDEAVEGEETGAVRVVDGHFAGDLSALATCNERILSAGGDDTLLLWDADSKQLQRRQTLNQSAAGASSKAARESKQHATALAVGDGVVLVGTGDGHLLSFSGKLKLLHRVHVESLLSRFHQRDGLSLSGPMHVTALSTAPDQQRVAVGMSSGALLTMSLGATSPVLLDCQVASQQPIDRIDWTEDSGHVLVTDHLTATTGFAVSQHSLLSSLSSSQCLLLHHARWHTVTSPTAFPIHALFTGQGVKAMQEAVVAVRGGEGKEEGLAVVGGSGGLRLYRWTGLCVSGQQGREVKAHVGRVGAVHWLNDKRLVSAGKDDLCIMQWKVT